MRKHGTDLAIGVALFIAALLVRWPHLMWLPAFGDESLEVRRGFEIATGGRLGLTGHDPYYGPIFPYLMAIGFKLFGIRLIVPRAIIAVFGALTVPLTFWFGRIVENRWTGIIAAVLVATCPALVLYSSHYGWSNSLTPFFATLALAFLYLGVEQRQKWALAASGFLVALAVQTHPLTAVPFAGTAVWLIRSRKRYPWLTWKELQRPALLCALGYSPMILENVVHPLIEVRVAFMRTYAFVPTLSPHVYLARLIDLGRTFLDILAGGLAFDNVPAPFIGVALAGSVLAGVVAVDLRRGNRLFSYALLATALVMPVFVKLYIPRYISFLVPFVSITAAGAVTRSIRDAIHGKATRQFQRVARWSGTGLAVITFAVTQVVSVRSISRYDSLAFANHLSNDAYYRLLGTINNRHACGPQLLVEGIPPPYADPAWVGLDAVDYVLTLSGCEHRQLTGEPLRSTMSAAGNGWAILSEATARKWSPLWPLKPIFVLDAPTGPDLVPITLYQVGGDAEGRADLVVPPSWMAPSGHVAGAPGEP